MAHTSASLDLTKTAIAVTLLLLKAPPARPLQDRATPETPPVVFQATRELVQVDAVVTDKRGRHVRDLTAEDFRIVEDGRVRPITHLRYVRTAPDIPRPAIAGAPRRTITPRPETTKRALAIVLDDLSLSFEGQVWARNALHRLVDERIGPGDLVSIVRTGGGIGNLQQFTNDKRLLDAAIDGVRFSLAGRSGLLLDGVRFNSAASNASTESLLHDLSRTGARGEAQTGATLPADTANAGTIEKEVRAFLEREDRARQVDVALGALAALECVVRGLERMPGRKSLLLVSEGFAMDDGSGDRGPVLDRLRALTDAAHRAAVVVYTMDPVGLRTFGGNFGGSVKEAVMHEGLIDLAGETGGLALLDSNDLDDSVARIFDDQSGYYLIGYQPDESHFLDDEGRPRFHRITLEVRRSGLRVRSRRGFYARSEPSEAGPRVTGLTDALFSPFPATEVPVRLTPLFSRDAERGSLVRCLLHVDAGKVTLAPESDGQLEAELEAGVVSIAANGRPAESNAAVYTVRLTLQAAVEARRAGLLLTLDLPAKPGPYQVRAAVWDRLSGRGGSAYQFLDVPDLGKGRLALSGIVMGGAASSTRTQPDSEDGEGAATPASADPDLTPAVRRFPPGAAVQYAFAVYNARRDRSSNQPRLTVHLSVYRDGTLLDHVPTGRLAVSATSTDAPVAIGGTLRLGPQIQPGDYALQVIVLDDVRGAKGGVAVQWIDFEVRGS